MAARDYERQNRDLQKAQKIVMELMSCLDMQNGGDIAKNLLALYSYIVNELVTANVEDKPEGIDRSLKILSSLRESWIEVEKSIRSGNTGQGAAIAA